MKTNSDHFRITANAVSILATRLAASARRRVPSLDDRERGDVPGWVMITLMSAVLVAGLLAIAAPALSDLFNQAMAKVGSQP